ncbi:ribonucleoside hydrolase RihC [Budvicia aquatica]|uniref:Ribonucleoside hydrolase RihC n=1 Tax=Budvicia aquatica TaxID=82979 RepID=A0A484ZX20_9GAMM|nr:ribonucleoside hydrolase RihC [Budvicia aquatica]
MKPRWPAHAIGELICNNPGEITLVAIGPLTNIAHAIQLYPDLAKSVAEIAIMAAYLTLTAILKILILASILKQLMWF